MTSSLCYPCQGGVKLAWGVPRTTHTYFVQQCLAPGATSARAEILARFAGFFSGLRNSPSPEVRTVALLCGRDLRTTTGSNIRVVEEASGLSVWTSTTVQVRRAVRQREVVASGGSLPTGAAAAVSLPRRH